jgi:hypothetical protein
MCYGWLKRSATAPWVRVAQMEVRAWAGPALKGKQSCLSTPAGPPGRGVRAGRGGGQAPPPPADGRAAGAAVEVLVPGRNLTVILMAAIIMVAIMTAIIMTVTNQGAKRARVSRR